MQSNATTRYIDLVYEDKNKSYGAYAMQQKHTGYVLIGFLVSSFLLAGGLGFKVWQNNQARLAESGTIKVEQKKVVAYSQLSAPPPIETIDNTPKTKPKFDLPKKRAIKKFLPPVVKKDEEVIEEEFIPTQKELKKVNIGKKDVEGDTTGAVLEFDVTDVEIALEETGKVDRVEETSVQASLPPPEPEPDNTVYTFVEKKPEFPGGQSAMLKFMYDNIIYPEIARENGIMGVVVIKFVVEKDGSISGAEIVKDVGGGCGAEAMRVLTTMPNWNPGIQNQIPVRASFILPIKFELTQ